MPAPERERVHRRVEPPRLRRRSRSGEPPRARTASAARPGSSAAAAPAAAPPPGDLLDERRLVLLEVVEQRRGPRRSSCPARSRRARRRTARRSRRRSSRCSACAARGSSGAPAGTRRSRSSCAPRPRPESRARQSATSRRAARTGTLRAFSQSRRTTRIEARLERVVLVLAPRTARAASSSRPISGSVNFSCVMRPSVASCSARTAAPRGGIIACWSHARIAAARPRSVISASRARSSSKAAVTTPNASACPRARPIGSTPGIRPGRCEILAPRAPRSTGAGFRPHPRRRSRACSGRGRSSSELPLPTRVARSPCAPRRPGPAGRSSGDGLPPS